MMQNLKRNWFVISKLRWEILTWTLENLKNLCFDGLLLTEVYNVWAKSVQRSYVWWHWILIQNLKKTNLCFQKLHEEFSKFSPEHVQKSKNWDSFRSVAIFWTASEALTS